MYLLLGVADVGVKNVTRTHQVHAATAEVYCWESLFIGASNFPHLHK